MMPSASLSPSPPSSPILQAVEQTPFYGVDHMRSMVSTLGYGKNIMMPCLATLVW